MAFGAREERAPTLKFGSSTHTPPPTDSHYYQQHTRSMNRRKTVSTFKAFAKLRTVHSPHWCFHLVVKWLERTGSFTNVLPPCWLRSETSPTALQWTGYDAPCSTRYLDLQFFVFVAYCSSHGHAIKSGSQPPVDVIKMESQWLYSFLHVLSTHLLSAPTTVFLTYATQVCIHVDWVEWSLI